MLISAQESNLLPVKLPPGQIPNAPWYTTLKCKRNEGSEQTLRIKKRSGGLTIPPPYGKPMARPSMISVFPCLPVASLGGITWNIPPAVTCLTDCAKCGFWKGKGDVPCGHGGYQVRWLRMYPLGACSRENRWELGSRQYSSAALSRYSLLSPAHFGCRRPGYSPPGK
jgi:hypothetical protein